LSLTLFFNDLLRLSNDYSCVTLPFLKDEKRFKQMKELLVSSHLKTLSADQQAALLRGVNSFIEIVSAVVQLISKRNGFVLEPLQLLSSCRLVTIVVAGFVP
jgi:hypothetical protein